MKCGMWAASCGRRTKSDNLRIDAPFAWECHRPFVPEQCKEVRLLGVYQRTLLDGNKEAHREMLLSFLRESTDAQSRGASPPAPDALGMKLYEPRSPSKRQLKKQSKEQAQFSDEAS